MYIGAESHAVTEDYKMQLRERHAGRKRVGWLDTDTVMGKKLFLTCLYVSTSILAKSYQNMF